MSEEKKSISDHRHKNAGLSKRYLRFRLNTEHFAIPLLSIREVAAMPEITKVPHTPVHFLGIMNLRGQIISVFDLRTKLGFKPENHGETSVIICDFHSLSFGVIVDTIDSVITVDECDITPRPDIDAKANYEYILGVVRQANELVLALDLAKALSVEDIIAMKRTAEVA